MISTFSLMGIAYVKVILQMEKFQTQIIVLQFHNPHNHVYVNEFGLFLLQGYNYYLLLLGFLVGCKKIIFALFSIPCKPLVTKSTSIQQLPNCIANITLLN